MANPNAKALERPDVQPDHTRLYLFVYVALLILALAKVGVFHLESVQAILVPAILVMTLIKFVMVVIYYMHLKFDHAILKGLFIVSLVLAVGSYTAVAYILLQ